MNALAMELQETVERREAAAVLFEGIIALDTEADFNEAWNFARETYGFGPDNNFDAARYYLVRTTGIIDYPEEG